MFESFSRSWKFASASYGLVWRNKRLLLFPLLSGCSAMLVLASFLLPLHFTDALVLWQEAAFETEGESLPLAAWVTLFGYYVVNYFVIVFFNAALVVCAIRHMQGQPVRLAEGLAMAARRWYAILGWAIVSAVVGVALRALESNKKIGRFIVSLLGTAWTAMTFFVVPVIVIDNRGPVAAVSESAGIMKKTWGTALTGNFSLALVNFVSSIPVIIVAFAALWAGFAVGTTTSIGLGLGAFVILILLLACFGAAAGTVFKAMLHCYATGKGLPEEISTRDFAEAFRSN
jgi:hypothetical protein